MAFVIPSIVQPGDTVFVIAPSTAVDREQFERTIKIIESLGLRTKHRPDVFDKDLNFAGSTERRRMEILEALEDESKVVWAARGGYGASYLSEVLDASKIRKAKKWLVGFSDITALHAAWGRAGVCSLHGATVGYLEKWSEEAKDELFSHLMNPKECVFQGKPVQGGKLVEGWLTGGNLTLLASMAGTGYLPSWQGAILFLEDVNEAPYRLDRQLLQLYQAGALEGIVGVAVGQFTECSGSDPTDIAESRVLRFLTTYLTEVAIVSDIPVGHENHSRALPFGAVATIDPKTGILRASLASENGDLPAQQPLT
jgi:muramoyltetrapeptide carboxypeptidase